jgi:Glycosyl hydrolase 108
MCGGGKGTGGYTPQGGSWGNLTPQQQVTTTLSPQGQGWVQQAFGLGQQAVSRPYQQFGTQASDFVAQLNAQQQAAQQGLASQAAATQPYANIGSSLTAQAGIANPAQMAQSYMNPFMNQVVNPVQSALQQQFGQQNAQQQAQAIQAGAFGGDRSGLQRAALQGQQGLALGQALSPLYQTGYGQALGAAQNQIQNQLTAGQNLANQGIAAQQASLGAGTLGQQTAQAGISALQNQFNQQQMWPYMQAQFLGNLAGGLAPLLGSMSYQSQATNPFGMFLSRGGAAEDRMGGAVVDAGDYARGGLAGGGVGDDDLVSEQEQMYKDIGKPENATMPTGQIQASKGPEPAQFGAMQKQPSALDKASQIVGLGKYIYGLGNSAYDTASGLGSALKTGLKFFTEGPGALLGFEDGGRISYQDGGDPPDDGFAPAVERTLKFEGGLNPRDTTGKPSMYGISQAAHPGIDVTKLTPAEAKDIYRKEYWEGIGASKLPAGVREMAYDTAVMAGPGKARQLLAKTGGDPEKFMEARRGFLNSLLARDPEKYGKYAKAWENRNRALEGASSGIGAASSGLTADRSTIPMGDPRRNFQATEPEKKEGLSGLLTEENVVPALMGLGSALEGMIGAKTVSPAAAIASGLGAGMREGAKSYMEVPKIKAETLERQNLAQRALAEAQHKLAEIPKVEAEAGKIGAETKQQEIANYLASIKDTPYGRVVFLANGAPMLASEFQERLQRGEQIPLLGALPSDAEARAATAFKEPGAATSTAVPEGKATIKPEAPKETVQAAPGVTYDASSKERAKREQAVGLNAGPQAELAKKNSDAYNEMVRSEAQGARENAPYMKELSTTLADAYTKHGMDEPGFKSEVRAEAINAANTFYHALGGEGDLGTLKRDQDVVNKISTLLSSDRARSGNQHAYAALETLKNAIPNLSMDPRAGAELTSQLMVLQQRALDRDAHKNQYAKDSNGWLNEAAQDFTDKSASRYQMETKIIKDLMLHRAGALKMMMSGHDVTPQQIEAKLKQWYGNDIPSDMYRYFAARR